MYIHLTAHARGNLLPLLDDDACRWLWSHLRDAFPTALAVLLMPDHPHLVVRWAAGARRKLAAILGACARFFGLGEVWQPVPEPSVLTTPDKLRRGVRYTVINCSRPWKHAGRFVQLVRDPLRWRWSTLRDAVGAVADPWTPIQRIGDALGRAGARLAERFHAYVSRDEHISRDGTPFPQRALSSSFPRVTLDAVAAAAVEAARALPDALRHRTPARRIFAALAFDQGWRQPAAIAEMCGVHPNSVPRIAASCPPEWLEAAALCLGDERLVVAPDVSRAMDGRRR